MDLLARKKLRDKKKKDEEIRKAVVEELFKKKDRAYVPSKRTLTIIAFLLFMLVIGFLIYDSKVLYKDECALKPGMECKALKLRKDMISFELHNFLKEDYNVTISVEGCEGEINKYIRPNNKALFEFECPDMEQSVDKDIYLNYMGFSGLPHDETGHVQGTVR